MSNLARKSYETKMKVVTDVHEEAQEEFDLDEYEHRHLKSVEHNESEGNWLVSYADMMTLLVGFFVMLFSFSKVDSAEFEKVKKETTKIFGGEYKIPFEELSKSLKKVIAEKNLKDQVSIQETDEGLFITFRGALFFDSGSSVLLDKAQDLLKQLVPEITAHAGNMGIVIEGHTDNRPIKSAIFPSNWELSSVRACTVLRYFLDSGFDANKVKAIGWGDRRPIHPNDDKDGNPLIENQSENRRVVIKVLKDFT